MELTPAFIEPETIQKSLTIRASVKEWRELCDELSKLNPVSPNLSNIRGSIRSMVELKP